jgi:hypothetical protein
MTRKLINLVLFKAGWIACVVLAARDLPMLATLSVGVVALIHLFSVSVPVKEAIFLLAAAVVGLAWESLVLSTGLIQYPESSQYGAWAPHWIVAMWVLFATTINHGLSWVKRNWMVSLTAGLIGGPVAFYAGAGLGAVTFTNQTLALALIGAGWAVLLPLVVLIADTIIDSPLLEPAEEGLRATSANSSGSTSVGHGRSQNA